MTTTYKYFDDTTPTSTRVWFRTVGEDGSTIYDLKDTACFSKLTYSDIPKTISKIIIYRDKKCVPYKPDAIRRWISELNGLGFTCSFDDSEAENYNFEVRFSDYTYKAHLISTLMLIRVLFESKICLIPELYFEALDKNQSADRFQELQNAHKSERLDKSHNWNHTITHKNNGGNVSRDELWKRYEATGFKVYDSHGTYPYIKRLGQDVQWKGAVGV